MAIIYTWKLTGLKKTRVNEFDGFVCQTYWKKIGTDEDGNTGEFAGATPFTPEADADPAEFTAWEDLTEEMVLAWIQAVVVGAYEEHVNGQIAKQIDEKVNPIVQVDEKEFPWSESEES
jgi:hypothetical protein